jgi:hypothetical protein
MRREVRRMRYDERLITRSEASDIGEVLEADFVVVFQAVTLHLEEKRMRERTRKAQTRGRSPQDTTYIEQTYTAEIVAEVEFQVIDTETRREVAEGSVDADASARMTRGVYEGDYRDLDLSRSDHRLFDEEELELSMREIEDELLDLLAPRLADAVFEKILQQIK